MVKKNKLPDELSFLNEIDDEGFGHYRECQYLVTPYEENIWVFHFRSRQSYSLNFNVKLDDGSLLTETKNSTLLNLFKSWICLQTHYDLTGLVILHNASAFKNIRQVVVLIDYFLLNSNHFKLSSYGLANVTENDLNNLMAQLVMSSESGISIYKWPSTLEGYLRNELARTDIKELLKLVDIHPFLGEDIPEIEDRVLGLNNNEIVLARALLWSKNKYKRFYSHQSETHSYRFAPDAYKLGQLIFPQTLRGQFIKMYPPELFLSPLDKYSKEFARAPVRNSTEDFLMESQWESYTKTICSLGFLAETYIQVPLSALKAFSSTSSKNYFLLKSKGRYATIPPDIVIESLRNAIEFSLTYGPDILDSVVNLISACKNTNQSKGIFSQTSSVGLYITPKLAHMGVKVWSLISETSKLNFKLHFTTKQRISTNDFFVRMRNNEGLYELLRVFFGAVQFCVGTLMARRQEELLKLVSGKVIDKDKKNIIFDNGKSGIGELRVKEARPAPSIVVKLIELIETFHQNLREIGFVTDQVKLFTYPNQITGKPVIVNSMRYNNSLEIFCDYIETPLNDAGQRHYFRQHQLRRFFAMLFFWGNSFGKMDTLQWFLGHTDIQHLYNYITETTPGHVLRTSKAYYGSEVIKTNPLAAPMLADLVEKHFGTRNFSVLDGEELIEYIEDLQLENKVQIEPIFFDCPEGKTYKIAIMVNRDLDHYNG